MSGIGKKAQIKLGNEIEKLRRESGGGGGSVQTWVIKPIRCMVENAGTPEEWTRCEIQEDSKDQRFTSDPVLGALAPGYFDNYDINGTPMSGPGQDSFYIELAISTGDSIDCLTGLGGSITPQVSTFAATNILDTSAVLNWQGNGELWNVEYGQVGFTPGTGTLVSGIAERLLQVTGLTDLTDYEYYVQGECGGSTSSWEGPAGTFTTLSAVGTCNYTVNMFDAYADGWNGASIDVDVAGVVTNVGLPTGGTGVAFVASLNGDNVVFTWNVGTYDNECSFDILAPDGTSIFSQLPAPAAPLPAGVFLTDVSNSTCT